jgi:hypothetical protein
MKRIKGVLALLLIVIFLFGLVGCSSADVESAEYTPEEQ